MVVQIIHTLTIISWDSVSQAIFWFCHPLTFLGLLSEPDQSLHNKGKCRGGAGDWHPLFIGKLFIFMCKIDKKIGNNVLAPFFSEEPQLAPSFSKCLDPALHNISDWLHIYRTHSIVCFKIGFSVFFFLKITKRKIY